MIYGVDLGKRSVYIAGIEGAHLFLRKLELKIRTNTRQDELVKISKFVRDNTQDGGYLFCEEPPLAGSRNIRTALNLSQTAGVIVASTLAEASLIPVASWKKDVIGNGAADKAGVSRWLNDHHPSYFAACEGDQNLIDATCLALYGLHHV